MLKPDLSVALGSVHLRNPVLTASGTFGYGKEYTPYLDLNALGGIIVKGLSLFPVRGNPPPRVVETASGMLNAIGLENVGIEAFIEEKVPFLETLSVPVIANIYGTSIEEYAAVAERLNGIPSVVGVEINISCPNVKAGGLAFGTDTRMAHQVTRTVRKRYSKLVMVKLSPNVTDVVAIARSVEDAGADALSLINTITGMAVDIHTRKPKLANIIGGLSGPAIKPVALRMVWQVARSVNVPVVGIGGIMSAEDALEFIIAGASAVQVGTANFIDPGCAVKIAQGIGNHLERENITSIKEMIGSLVVEAS